MVNNNSTSIRQKKKIHTKLTSMRYDTHVWPNELHVDTVLLLSDDDGPPQATIANIPIIFSSFNRPQIGWGHWCVIWAPKNIKHLFINKCLNNLFHKSSINNYITYVFIPGRSSKRNREHETLPSHSRSLPLVGNSRESVSSGVSMSSTLISRSSGVSRKSSESNDPSLWSKDRFISGATRVRRLRWPEPPPAPVMWSELGGAGWQKVQRKMEGLNIHERVNKSLCFMFTFLKDEAYIQYVHLHVLSSPSV